MIIWRLAGRVAFWLALPALRIYLNLRVRTRVLIVSEGKVLLVKPWMGSGLWILPGGGLHKDEDPAIGAAREVREETGIILLPSKLRTVGTTQYSRFGLKFRYHQFITELPALLEPSAGRPEVLEVAWMELRDMDRSIVDDDVLNLLEQWRQLS